MSMESGTQGYNQDFDNRKERDMSHFPENVCFESLRTCLDHACADTGYFAA